MPADTFKKTLNRVCLTYAGFMIAIILVGVVAVLGVEVSLALSDGYLEAFQTKGIEGATEFLSDPDFTKRVSEVVSESSALVQIVSIAVGALLFFILRGKKLLTTDITARNQTPRPATLLACFCLALGVQFVLLVFNVLTAPVMEQAGLSFTEAMNDATTSLAASPLGIFYILAIGPLIEEIVFRGAILRALEPYGANFACVVSAILFGLYHIILYQAVFTFLLGLVLAYTAGRFSLKWAYLLHVANNALALLSLFLAPLFGDELVGGFLLIVFLGGFIAAIIILRRKRLVLQAQKYAGAPVVQQPFRVLLARPAFVITAGFIIVMGISYLQV